MIQIIIIMVKSANTYIELFTRWPPKQCCGSAPLTSGSGSGSRSWYFRQWPSRRQLKFIVFLLITFWRYINTVFLKIKSNKKSYKTVVLKVFSYYFCLMIEGSGSVPRTNGSGSRRSCNIRIRNTALKLNNFQNTPIPITKEKNMAVYSLSAVLVGRGLVSD